ncbi:MULTISPECIES: enoyl-CoA hydratase-related protein [unclassified Sphingomonas]|uniref:enoyl-CoA hydratase-related protein n=1 Tax=unclassified Sphingomonas TaxID=196159 RepID=UPI002859B00B|nr:MULTISPECIES: enoyl-CoA hydratase-related protein [unclassified Sphingomonas]MDR6114810.1 2-(1,2-epoxy-1,2-dihydrophenyl)acetyl-CoA isomerase [Sphingomonas sp. SORGH_AS_0789]MDR6151517.1 2-(1,2-epoxy-1,2-dihydrophenyl)acetyl-CoA isomerase [Sphingomonas sp. SORGH_AS_0742]
MLRTERRGDVLALTLDRPDRLNAAPPALFDAIRAALAERGDARAILIAGEGRAFCSGADISGGDVGPDTVHRALVAHCNPVMLALADLPIPVVSAVRGAAAGIGCSLALAADFCVASESAYFLHAFVNIGMVPDGGASWMLPRLIGRARAAEMMMLGERVGAAKALDWGMIHKVVADGALDAEAWALAERLAAGPSVALGLMRRALHAGFDSDYAAALAREAQDQRSACATLDGKEGSRAFFEKRPPRFLGR